MQVLAATSAGRKVIFLLYWVLILLFETVFVHSRCFMFYLFTQKYAGTGLAMNNVTFGDRSTLTHWSTYVVTELHN